MANGIDSIYDPSDVRRMLAELREERLQMEEDRRKKTKSGTTTLTKLWEMWGSEQSMLEKELLATKDYVRNPKVNWLTRSFTPASKRVIPTEEFAGRLKDWEDTGKIISDGRASMRLPSGEVIGSASVPKDIRSVSVPKDVAAKFGLKEVGSGISAGVSLYDTISSWDEHKKNKDLKRGVDVGKTLAYTASAVPGPHQVVTTPIALGLTLADLFI